MTVSPRSCLAGALALVTVVPAAFAATSVPAPGATLRVHVFAASTSQPIAGAMAEIAPVDAEGAFRPGIADAQGWIEWTGLPPGRYRARVGARGFVDSRAETIALLPGGGVVSQYAALLAGTALEGRVVDASGRPVGSARACLSSPVAHSATVAAGFQPASLFGGPLCVPAAGDGSVSFPDLPMGQYRLSVNAPGHSSIDGQMLDLASAGAPTWVLSPAGSIAGRVLDIGGMPVASAKITLKDRLRGTSVPAATDASGSFRADGLAAGPWRVEIEPAEHLTMVRDGVLVKASQQSDLGTLRARAAAAIEGRLLGSDGAPVAAAEVRVQESGGARKILRRTVTDEKGGFRVAGLPSGAAVDLLAKPKSGWTPKSFHRIAVPTTGGTFALEATARISGVVSVESGALPAAARASAFPRKEHPAFDANGGLAASAPVDPATGAFTLENIPAGGPVEIRVHAPGLSEGRAEADLSPGREASAVAVRIGSRGPAVRGEVRDGRGNPVVGARLGLAITDEQGRFVLEGLDPGTTRLVVQHPSFAPAVKELRPGAERDAVVVLEDGGSIEGTVSDSDGRPVAGVRLATDWPGVTATTGAGGRYRLDRVPSGDAGIQRQALGTSGDVERKKTTVRAGETGRLDFRIGSAALEGALARGGEPVVGADISLHQPLGGAKGLRAEEYLLQSTTSDEEGRYRLVGVRPGRATLTVNLGTESLVMPAYVAGDSGARLDLDLPAHVLEGMVLGVDGKPIVGACVASELLRAAGDSPAHIGRVAGDGAGETADAEQDEPRGYSRVNTDGEGRFRLSVEEPDVANVTVCTCASGCQEIAVEDAAGGPVTLWYAPIAKEKAEEEASEKK